MFSNLRSLIFKLDPETAHNLAIKSLKLNFVPNIFDKNDNGQKALDLAYISTGRLDAIWAHGVKLWDVAAGLLIAQESGALISNFNGDPKYLDGDHFICSSPKVYKSILKSVKPYFKA